MKWSIAQLKKLTVNPYQFSLEFDYSEEVKEIEDIQKINIALVEGTITRVDDELFKCQYHLQVELVLSCALTLEPVGYSMDLEQTDLIGYPNDENDDVIEITNNTIDMRNIVWDSILVNIPIRVVREDAYDILAKRNIILDEEIPDDDN
ncbi:MAG: hypothetical protein IJ501_01185 [Bacilli bacterium]|nr:hypothetical protein [Bacilli bacterium]MBQ8472096.1 hypothetical protein [Bacilli bacterium]